MGDVDKDMAEEGLHTHPPVSVNTVTVNTVWFLSENEYVTTQHVCGGGIGNGRRRSAW
jgi:hypothetical protein